MRTIKRILELHHTRGLSVREIARSTGQASSTVGALLKEAERAGLSWPLPEGLDQEGLHALLRGKDPRKRKAVKPLPEWKTVEQELRDSKVTLRLLWEEYREVHPEGYGYSRYCELFARWRGGKDPRMRRPPDPPGRVMYVDWAGPTVPVRNPKTGETTRASLFIGVLGHSQFIYAEAFGDQKLGAWVRGHVHAWEAAGGACELTVPDNPKTGVIHADKYEPKLHPTYEELAAHYGTVIVPARPAAPRDKASAETAVQIAERRILAALRHQVFFSLEELNRFIRLRLREINRKPFQKREGSRIEALEIERNALTALPDTPYELAHWRAAKVNIDYHVSVDTHLYSVPYQHVGKQVDVRLGEQTVELFLEGVRIAAHARSRTRGGATTDPAHRPKSHQAHLEWTPGRMIEWAGTIGPAAAKVVGHILEHKPHPEQGYRSCLGLIRLAKGVGHARMERACRRALHYDLCSYRQVKSILKNRLDTEPLKTASSAPRAPLHPNLRGPGYYR